MLQPPIHTDDERSLSCTEAAVDDEDPLQRPTTLPVEESNGHWIIPFLFGQAIAFIAASMNASSYVLVSKYSVQTRLFPLFFVYLLLSLHLLLSIRNRPGEGLQKVDDSVDNDAVVVVPHAPNDTTMEELNNEEEIWTTNDDASYPFFFFLRLRIPWYYYLCISLLDVTPNLLALYSFQYTSLTSTTLLGSLSVPSTLLFSRLLLRRVFTCHHYVGVLLCVLGGGLTVYMDAVHDKDDNVHDSSSSSSSSNHHHSYMGDVLAIVSAILYGLGDCVAEYFVKQMDRYEYLGMLGFFGLVISGLLFPWLEYQALQDLLFRFFSPAVAELFVAFVSAVVLYYVLEARFLVSSDATLLNLSMQSVNLWAYLFTRATERPPTVFFLAAVGLVVLGVFLYERGGGVASVQRRLRSNSQVEIVHPPRPVQYQAL